MIPTDDNIDLRSDRDRRLDLLVDGELSEAERRALLCQFEQEPQGWRSCALAFLEAQCWKQELGGLATAAASDGPAPPASTPRGPWRERLMTLAAMAASFLLALALGMQLKWNGGLGTGTPSPESVATTDAPRSRDLSPQRPGRDISPLGEADASRWQMVTLSVPQGPDGDMETIRLPAMEREALDPEWLEGAAVPAEVLQALKHTGHNVQTRRELVPIELRDGRRLVVPVDQVDVHFVGRPAL